MSHAGSERKGKRAGLVSGRRFHRTFKGVGVVFNCGRCVCGWLMQFDSEIVFLRNWGPDNGPLDDFLRMMMVEEKL